MISPFGLRTTIGREHNVDLDDVRRVKKALRYTGYFETPSYGLTDYPDEPLFNAIEMFQSDNDLRRDGVMKPDGETAKTLGRVLGQREPKANTKQDPKASRRAEVKTAFAAPVIVRLAGLMGISIAAAWQWWQTQSDSEKQAIESRIWRRDEDDDQDDADAGLDHCDHLHYEVDIPVCEKIGQTRGDAAAQKCYASAYRRYAACIAGTPTQELPPLDTWNN
ncbi:MAG: peptidoglycan-binding domain-containing protein [Rhodospirillales bacterium]